MTKEYKAHLLPLKENLVSTHYYHYYYKTFATENNTMTILIMFQASCQKMQIIASMQTTYAKFSFKQETMKKCQNA